MKKSFISNLQNRKLGKIVANMARAKAQQEEDMALEEYAIKLKNKGVRIKCGQNYDLVLK